MAYTEDDWYFCDLCGVLLYPNYIPDESQYAIDIFHLYGNHKTDGGWSTYLSKLDGNAHLLIPDMVEYLQNTYGK